VIPLLTAAWLCIPVAQAAPPGTSSLTDLTSRQVSAYLDQVSDVTCTEQVTQFKLGPNGHVENSESATYDYFILLQGGADDFLLNESRLPTGRPAKPAKNVSLLISNGFSTLFLIFHPYYLSGFRFEADREEVVAGHTLERVKFTAIPGARTPAALAVRGREYPLPLDGRAWIDPQTGVVTHIQAALAADFHDVGLRSMEVDVEYAPVRLPGWQHDYLFPSVATVEVETMRQHWRNIHRFSHYRQFMVGAEQTVSDKVTKK
jgi:hypothetical protein